ncbi:MAG TPA: UDP-N-acetylmuramoyl-L-alanyl-D-glutamate--2,6-diaminopimelate ligase [Terriglobales bacterium]|nr:UDP-N-acetylmuramoyl-L-alanyl-D-glutamate--2,6-diaminopimelate ligase [Terriglobales bacterium]
MQTEEFLRGVEVVERRGPVPLTVTGVHYDSRQVAAGGAFAAIRGEKLDGNAYIAGALAHGAALVITDRPAAATPPDYHEVVVPSARIALAQTAANWFQHPGAKLRLVGITGTNGKTTTAGLIDALLRAQGWTTGLLGTIEYRIGAEVLAAPHTTPESYDLQALLARMAGAGCAGAVMEVSSHALALDRVWGLEFEVAVFTNLTQDHLDYHHTMERYREAKRRLFTGLGAPPPRVAVVNADDAASTEMIRGSRSQVLTYGISPAAALRATAIEISPAGVRFTLLGPGADDAPLPVASPLLGRMNVLNLLAAIGTGLGLGVEREAAVRGVAGLARVPGRFERVDAGQPFSVVVDYAHTPDALINVLALARNLTAGGAAGGGGRVLVVFGCGGERDRGKRPLMGAAAARGADWVMLTSDNPRSEDPERILDEISAAAPGAAREVDRGRAIAATLAAARSGDVVVIAGKGHERYQTIGSEQIPFEDAAVARAALGELGWHG